jgi:DNA-binding NarL/FixJ family response regulator
MACRVFLCDDTDEYRALLRVVLERAGGEIVGEAGNGRDCVEAIAETNPDLVLLDVKMPVMGGLEALPLVRERAPDAQVVVLSTAWAEQVAHETERLGARAFLEKPRDILELPDRLREVLCA